MELLMTVNTETGAVTARQLSARESKLLLVGELGEKITDVVDAFLEDVKTNEEAVSMSVALASMVFDSVYRQGKANVADNDSCATGR